MICAKDFGPIPNMSPALKTVPKSSVESPKFSIARVGAYFLLSLTGFVLVKH